MRNWPPHGVLFHNTPFPFSHIECIICNQAYWRLHTCDWQKYDWVFLLTYRNVVWCMTCDIATGRDWKRIHATQGQELSFSVVESKAYLWLFIGRRILLCCYVSVFSINNSCNIMCHWVRGRVTNFCSLHVRRIPEWENTSKSTGRCACMKGIVVGPFLWLCYTPVGTRL